MADLSVRRKAMLHLYEAEYGNVPELCMRFTAITALSVLFYVYTGWTSTIVWFVGNVALQTLQYSYLTARAESPTHCDVLVGRMIYLAVLAWFLWLPTSVILEDDAVLRITAATAYATTLLFLVRRYDTDAAMVAGVCTVVAITMLYLMLGAAETSSRTLVLVGIAICGSVFIGSFYMTLAANRRRTLEIDRAARRMLDAQRIESVGRLASGVAHDFNNVLTAIRGNLELLELAPAERQATLLSNALQASEQAEALVQRLLTYSRNQDAEPPSTLDMNQQLVTLQRLLDRLLGSRSNLHFVPADTPAYVLVDQHRLSMAIMNLVINARDAMPEGGEIELKVAVCSVEHPLSLLGGQRLAPGSYVRLCVQDNGSGIPPEVQDRIAEPFFTTKPEGEGTGLGLYMVCEFAAQVSGGVSFVTSPCGTTVSVWLPEQGD